MRMHVSPARLPSKRIHGLCLGSRRRVTAPGGITGVRLQPRVSRQYKRHGNTITRLAYSKLRQVSLEKNVLFLRLRLTAHFAERDRLSKPAVPENKNDHLCQLDPK